MNFHHQNVQDNILFEKLSQQKDQQPTTTRPEKVFPQPPHIGKV